MVRMIKAALALGLVAPIALAAPAAAAPLGDWYGRYVWEESLGRIGGSTPSEGAAAFVTRTLYLGRAAGASGCSVDAEGFQTDTHIACTATPQGNAIVVKFYKERAASRGGRYPRGAALFTLTRTRGGLVTRLQALEPSSPATPHRGRLFRRVG